MADNHREDTIDWHFERAFKLAAQSVAANAEDPTVCMKAMFFSFLMRSKDHLGCSKMEVFDAVEETKTMFFEAWMEESKGEVKH